MFMDFKFSKDSGNSLPEGSAGEKKSQNSLLVLLLILVGGFTYIYFFTGLIKPLEVQETAQAPAPAPQAVKIPLPAREGEPVKVTGETPAIAEAPKTAASSPATATAPPVKPVAQPANPVTPPAAKAAPASAKPKEEPKKAAAAKPAEKKPQPVAVAEKKEDKTAATKTEAKKTAADTKNLTITDKKSPIKDGVKKPTSQGQVKSGHVVKAKKDTPDSWSLVVGNYVLEEALSADMGRVRKAGFVPVVKPSARKKANMNRLFVSDFNDRATAQSTLEKLKQHTSDAFIIEQGGRFAVYAGSYLQKESANSEKERLKAAGFSTIVKHSDISIPSQSLSIGPFTNKKAAVAALDRLKRAGIKAAITQ